MSMIDPTDDEPVRLFEDADTGDRFLIYNTDKGVRVELRYDGAAFWMTQAQMSELFGRDVSVISRHIANVFDDGELPQGDLHILQIRGPGNRPIATYSLDMTISVGYRVSSTQATLFRRWATAVLVRFATKGFIINVERLRNEGDYDRIAELRDAIRDIRASEANMYAELRRICAMCQDYDGASDSAREFYQKTQAKLVYAVASCTPSELLIGRANAASINMGLQTWPKDEIRQADAIVAKNYLMPAEIKELNRLTTILLDIFEDQLEIGKLTTMSDAARLLDRQLSQLNRSVLHHGGNVAHHRAESAAKREYEKFDKKRKAARKAQADAELKALRDVDSALPNVRKPRGPSSK